MIAGRDMDLQAPLRVALTPPLRFVEALLLFAYNQREFARISFQLVTVHGPHVVHSQLIVAAGSQFVFAFVLITAKFSTTEIANEFRSRTATLQGNLAEDVGDVFYPLPSVVKIEP